MSKTTGTISIIVTTIVAIGTYGVAAVMFNNLLTPWWIPGGYAFAFAVLTFVLAPKTASIVTDSANRWVNGIVHVGVITGVFLCSITAVNNIGVSSRVPEHVDAQIVKAYQTTHYTSRRISRNTYVKGSPYQVYHLQLLFPNGKEKTVTVPRETYTKLSRRKTVPVTLTPGLLGMQIIRGI